MKTLFTLLVMAACILSFAAVSYAADPVDLTGKKGVVDPKDLKKDDPKPKKLTNNPPPAPGSSDKKESGPNYKGTYGQAK